LPTREQVRSDELTTNRTNIEKPSTTELGLKKIEIKSTDIASSIKENWKMHHPVGLSQEPP
jgi:hypothetical protein